MQVNYLSNAYLVKLLVKMLSASLASKVVVLSAESHRFAPDSTASLWKLDFSQTAAQYISSIDQYNSSKLYVGLMAVYLPRQYRHLGLRCYAVHPGNMVYTRIQYAAWWPYRLVWGLARPFTKSADQAAASVVFPLVSP